MLSAAIRARSAFVRRRRPLGPSITSSRETPTPIEPSKWTPILPSLSKSKTSVTRIRAKCPGQLKNGRRGSASRLQLKIEKSRLCSELAQTPAPPALRLHPALTERFRAKVADLAASLADPSIQPQATEALRALISEARLIPDPKARDGHHIELVGDLAAILALDEGETQKAPRLAGLGGDMQIKVVAGTGFANCFAMSKAIILPCPATAA